MCDYSLHAVASRPAKVGERLIATSFSGGTRGFAAEGEPNVAVCLLQGTLAFEPGSFSSLRLSRMTWTFDTAVEDVLVNSSCL
jgi:hypothetical protein